MITVVTGQGRCGTSAMMGALKAGGLPLYENKGHVLHELNLMAGEEWADVLRAADGAAVKVFNGCPVRPELLDEGYEICSILMRRDFKQQAASWQKVRTEIEGEAPMPFDALVNLLIKREQVVLKRCELMGNVIIVQFENMLDTPRRVMDAVVDYLGIDLDRRAMAQSIVRRSPEAAVGFLEKELYEERTGKQWTADRFHLRANKKGRTKV